VTSDAVFDALLELGHSELEVLARRGRRLTVWSPRQAAVLPQVCRCFSAAGRWF
jgi:hypothetical protein